jgi:hypothetical protein
VTVERQRWCRALLVCTTCRIVVATGPVCEREPLAAYELGRVDAARGPLHIGVCAGGILDVLLEEVPNSPPPGGGSYETDSSRSSAYVPYETGRGRRGQSARGLRAV